MQRSGQLKVTLHTKRAQQSLKTILQSSELAMAIQPNLSYATPDTHALGLATPGGHHKHRAHAPIVKHMLMLTPLPFPIPNPSQPHSFAANLHTRGAMPQCMQAVAIPTHIPTQAATGSSQGDGQGQPAAAAPQPQRCRQWVAAAAVRSAAAAPKQQRAGWRCVRQLGKVNART
jgi:hypothetical protein